ncbi:acyl-CoA N-acyltransferase [Syncephalis plumigaleata]|nr:acyl-CoA N-acyltransferase [Syncephalis plumigaleata]
MSNRTALEFALVADVAQAYELERDGYPPSEAASYEALRYRQEQAPELFLGAYMPIATASTETRSLVGFITATLAVDPCITAASMTQHDPLGKTVCIHSVCVDKAHRRKGIALALLREYEHRLRQANTKYALVSNSNQNRYNKVALLAHQALIPLYQKAGYILIGQSSVAHGPDPWFELHLVL